MENMTPDEEISLPSSGFDDFDVEEKDRNLIDEIIRYVNSDVVFTDLNIEEGAEVMAKTPSGWKAVPEIPPPSKDTIIKILRKMDANWDATIKEKALNRPLDLTDWRLRISACLAFSGDKLVLSIRRIPPEPLPLEKTGLPQSVRLMLEIPRGLILINGSTGSGKSTTLAALVDAINKLRSDHIITIEDPIEFMFKRKKSIFTQREIGSDVASFYNGVKDAMRQRPNVIVIGEIVNKDTAEQALLAADSGVLVIGTVHANSVSSAIQKMLSFFSSDEREAKLQSLSSNLVGVISQILLPTEDKSGWVLAAELLFNQKQQTSSMIGDSEKIAHYLRRKDRADEHALSCSMEDALFALVKNKKITPTEAIRSISGIPQSTLIDRLKTPA